MGQDPRLTACKDFYTSPCLMDLAGGMAAFQEMIKDIDSSAEEVQRLETEIVMPKGILRDIPNYKEEKSPESEGDIDRNPGEEKDEVLGELSQRIELRIQSGIKGIDMCRMEEQDIMDRM